MRLFRRRVRRSRQAVWRDYVHELAGVALPAEVAGRMGAEVSAVARWWWAGDDPDEPHLIPSPPYVRAFSLAYGHSQVEGLVAAGYLSPDEASFAPGVERWRP